MKKSAFVLAMAAVTAVFAGNNNGGCCEPSPHWIAGVEYLYWTADAAVAPAVYTLNIPSEVFSVYNGAKAIPTRWSSGFKAFVGEMPECGWGWVAQYTWWRQSQTRITEIGGFDGLSSPWLPSTLVADTAVGASWNVRIQSLDLLTARKFWLSPCVYVLPYGGLRAVYIDQDIRVAGADLDFGAAQSFNKSRSWGIAPALGVRLGSHFWKNFEIYVDGTLDVGYRNSLYSHNGDEGGLNIANFADFSIRDATATRVHVGSEIGIDYAFDFKCFPSVVLGASYGFQTYFDELRTLNYTGSAIGGVVFDYHNLYVQGLSVQLGISF